MKRHLQCAEQQVSLSNLTKYCACHEKWHCKISEKISKNRWNVISNAGTIRAWSEHDPTMIRPWSEHDPTVRNPPRKWGYFSNSPRAFCIEKYNVSRPILHSNIHQMLRLPWKVTLELHQVLHLPQKVALELHQILRLPRKMSPMLDPRYIWNLISNARSNRCHYPTSPNTVPATKNDTARFQRKSPKTDETWFPMRGRSEHDPSMIRPWSDHDPTMIRPWNRQSATRLASEVTFRTHHEHFLLKNTTFRAQSYIQTFTKCCTRRLTYLVLITYETSFTVRGATGVTIQPHQILRLSRRKTHIRSPHRIWNVIYTARSNRCHQPTSPNTAPVTQKDSHT